MNNIRLLLFGASFILSYGCGLAQTYESLARTVSSATESLHADLRPYADKNLDTMKEGDVMRKLSRYSEIAVRDVRLLTSLLRAADKAAGSKKHKILVGKRLEDSLVQLSKLDAQLGDMQKLSDALTNDTLVNYRRRIGDLRSRIVTLQKEIASMLAPGTKKSS